MNEKTFECCFERKGKGTFMEVSKGSKNIEFVTFYDFKHQCSVCLRKEEVEELIGFLKESIKDF